MPYILLLTYRAMRWKPDGMDQIGLVIAHDACS